jgi:hypothetical protein
MSVMPAGFEPGRVELKICSPHQPVRFISARLSGQIRALQCLWRGSPKRFIFNGVELLEENTFEFYGIRDGDSIVALPIDDRDPINGTSQWLSLTRDSESFNESLRWMLDPATSGEAARLRDLQLMRLEGRPRAIMKMCAPAGSEEGRVPRTDSSTVLGLPPKSPSVDALPMEW